MPVVSLRILIPLALSLIAGIWILWKSANIPGRVAIINSSGHRLSEVTVSGAQVGEMRTGASRVVVLPAPQSALVHFRGQRARTWRSPSDLLPGQTMVLYITPEDEVDARAKIGSYAR